MDYFRDFRHAGAVRLPALCTFATTYQAIGRVKEAVKEARAAIYGTQWS